MSRLTTILVLAVGVLAGGLGATLLSGPKLDEAGARAIAEEVVAQAKPEPGLTASAVETIVADLIARQPKQDSPQPVAALEQSTLDPMIEKYLLGNPRILQKVSAALDAELTAERTAATRTAMVLSLIHI